MAKTINARLQQKHDFEKHWNLAEGFCPLNGEIIVYDIEVDEQGNVLTDSNGNSVLPEGRTEPYNYPRFKVGDGVRYVNDLPFLSSLVYIQDTAPENVPEGTLWLDTSGDGLAEAEGVEF